MSDKEQNAEPTAPEAKSSKQQAKELLDHEYDGIREYDNPLPGWWVLIFWGTFFFAIGYVFHYHIGNGLSVAASYEEDMARAHEEQAKRAMGETVSEATLTKLMADQSPMADAKTIFLQRCTPCHGQQAQGAIGPNLTDSYWIHGTGTLMDIFHTVSQGVPEKGMPPWGMQLSSIQVRELAAYVGTLRGTNVPGGKAPEGTLIDGGP